MLNFLERMAFVHKLVAALGVMFLVVLVFYFLFYQNLLSEKKDLNTQIENLKSEYIILKGKKRRFENDLRCLEELKSCHEQLRIMLPSRGETNQLLKNITEEGRKAGLEFLFFEEQREVVAEEMDHAAIDIKMHVRGFYFQLIDFLEKLRILTRIVSVEKMTLTDAMPKETGVSLKAEFMIRTFRHLTSDEIIQREQAKKQKKKKK